MAENEIEIAGEVGLPFTAKLSVRFKRRWTDRANKLIEDVSHETGLDALQLEDRMEQDERLESTMLEAVAMAGRVPDRQYREALARVVAAAFEDEAKVDEIEQLAAQLMALDAFALRVLVEAYQGHDRKPVTFPGFSIDPYRAQKALGVDSTAIAASLARLAGLGFVASGLTMPDVSRGLLESGTGGQEYWRTTRWGLRALELCNLQLDRATDRPAG
jgi:hypothetical protein